MVFARLSVWEEAVPYLLLWCQTLHLLPVCHWCLSSCYPGTGAQRERVWISPCVGSSRGTAWDSRSFFYQLYPCWFLQPEVMGTYHPGTGTLGCGACCGAGTPRSWDIPPEFLSSTRGCGASLFHDSIPPNSWMDVVSLIPCLSDFHSTRVLVVLSDGCSMI